MSTAININLNSLTFGQNPNEVIKFLDGGIHEDLHMDSLDFKTSDNDNKFLAWYFKDANGKQVSHTEWEPTRRDTDTEESFSKKISNMVSRIGQIMVQGGYISREQFPSSYTDFQLFATTIVNLLPVDYKNRKVRIKVVYSTSTNGKSYTGLPKYAKYQFIESMSVSKDDSLIQVLGIDVFDRPVADKESVVENQFEAGSTSDNNPF